MKMKVKKGVVLFGLKIEMRPVLGHASEIWARYRQTLVVTETVGAVHDSWSLHPYGWAVDLRSRYFKRKNRLLIAAELAAVLGSDYDVVVHKTHIHVEWDKGKHFVRG